MKPRDAAEPSATDVQVVEELLRVLAKGQRALQMYLPNNPVYQRTLEQVSTAFTPLWDVTDRLTLDIQDEHITWDGVRVGQSVDRGEGLAWQLYKDGLRQLVLLPGVETEEIFRLLRIANRARLLTADATDDLLTLLWEQDFTTISYAFVEPLGEGTDFVRRGGASGGPSGGPSSGGGETADPRQEVAADRGAAGAAGSLPGVVDPDDFDGTPYFLEEAEIRRIRSDLDDEYRRDIRQAAIDALLDILESQRNADVRREAIALFEEILPTQLAMGGFRAVARMLRELRLIAGRASGFDDTLRQAVLSFEERLSTPDILEQVFRVLADQSAMASDDDIGEVLRELRPAALPVVLTHLVHVTDVGARRTLEANVDMLGRSHPDALAALITSGPDAVLIPAIGLASRLGLGQLVPAIVGHLQTGDDALRLAAVRALGTLGSPTAVAAVETALDDPERTVRQEALAMLVSRGGSGGLRSRLEAMLFDTPERDWERSERRAILEAYGTIAGASALPRLAELLQPRGLFRRRASADVRAAALFALAKVGTPDARAMVVPCSSDGDAVVRSAANAILRDWPS